MIKLIDYSKMKLSELLNIALEKSEKEDPTLFGLIQEQRRKSNELFDKLVTEENGDETKALDKFNSTMAFGSKLFVKHYIQNTKELKNYQDIYILAAAYMDGLIDHKLDWAKLLLINYLLQ